MLSTSSQLNQDPKKRAHVEQAIASLSVASLSRAFESGTLEISDNCREVERSFNLHSRLDNNGFHTQRYDREMRKQDRAIVRGLASRRYGNLLLHSSSLFHGSIVPIFRQWRAENQETPLLVLNWDTHHDLYTHTNAPSPSWARYLNRSSDTQVIHFPSRFSQALGTYPQGGELDVSVTLPQPPFKFDYIPGTPWQETDAPRISTGRYRQAPGEVWVSMDFDYFECARDSRDSPHSLPSCSSIEHELREIIRFLFENELPVTRVFSCKEPLYVGLPEEKLRAFYKNVEMSFFQAFGRLGLTQAGLIDSGSLSSP